MNAQPLPTALAGQDGGGISNQAAPAHLESSTHFEMYIGIREGKPIAVICRCAIGHDHSLEDTRPHWPQDDPGSPAQPH